MNTDLDDRLRRLDPAHDTAEALLDPAGPTADAIHTRALTSTAQPTTSRRRWPAIAASVVAAAGIGAGAVAVADRRPPESSAEVCDSVGTEWWPDSPPPACADVVIPSILASIDDNGSPRERALVADGVISDDEWGDVNDDLLACLRTGGLDAELDPQIFLDVPDYDLTWRADDDVDDEQLLRDCEAEYKPYRIAALYRAQAIGRQDGPRLSPGEVESILDNDAERGDVFGPDDPDVPLETMTPQGGDR